MARVSVSNNTERSRYELHRDGELCSFGDYRWSDNVVAVFHVETLPEHRGEGNADILMAGILDDLRSLGAKIRPSCPFAASYVSEHPEHHDLVAG
ncbi:MAG: GNAT family N-acetyltransferase [Actinomycetota bacterium]